MTVGLYMACTRCGTRVLRASALYNLVIIGALLSIPPLIVLFLVVQRYRQSGWMSGAVKSRWEAWA